MSVSFWRYWGPLALYMAFVFYVSSRSRPATFDDTPDVFLHGGAYFVMAVLAVRALAHGLSKPTSPHWAVALVGGVAIAIVYGASDELHQSFVASRVGSWHDVMFDAMGAALAGVALGLFWWVGGERS